MTGSGKTLYVGLDVYRHHGVGSVRVAASSGQRVVIARCDLKDPAEWLDLALYGLTGVPVDVRVAVCTHVPMTRDQRDAITKAGGRFGSIAVHGSAYALTKGSKREEALAIVVGDEGSSVAIVRGREPTAAEQDLVRPIARREARELAVSARCLLKTTPRDVVGRLLRSVVVSGDEDELERIGHKAILRELEALGAVAPTFTIDPFVVAEGAALIAAAQPLPPRGSL